MRVVLVSFVPDISSTGMGRWTHRVGAALRAEGHDVELWFNDQFPVLRASGRGSINTVSTIFGIKACPG